MNHVPSNDHRPHLIFEADEKHDDNGLRAFFPREIRLFTTGGKVPRVFRHTKPQRVPPSHGQLTAHARTAFASVVWSADEDGQRVSTGGVECDSGK